MRAAALLLASLMAFGAAEAQVAVYAAGSLRAPLTEAARLFEAEAQGPKLDLVFGASGLLRDRIARGEPAQVFASAKQPQLQVVQIPEALNVGADYGLSVRKGAPPAAEAFAALLLSARGREILERHGFLPPPR